MEQGKKDKKKKRTGLASVVRTFRKIHRTAAILLFVFFMIMAVTGMLLGWKKHSGDMIMPKSYTGIKNDIEGCLPVDSLRTIAFRILHDSVSPSLSTRLDRIDIRPEKGMVKFIFLNHYHEIQLDGHTGELLNIGFRASDLIENIHDASFLDRVLRTSNGQIKLVYTSIMGLALFTFVVTGFWLWYGPRRIRKTKASEKISSRKKH